MKFLRFWFPVISYSAMIFYVSGLPNLHVSFGFCYFDKILHVGEYAILGLLFARALMGTRSGLSFFAIMGITALFILCFGASDEWHQMYVPGRDMNGADVFADCIGGMLGAFIYLTVIKQTKPWHR